MQWILPKLPIALTSDMPRAETYGIVVQIRASAASVPANIAEGYGRESTGSYVQFLKTARGLSHGIGDPRAACGARWSD